MKQHKIISILLIILLVISIPTLKVNAAKTTYKYSFEYTSIFAYNGKVQKPTSVTVKVNGKKVAKSKVTISKYSNSKSTNLGKYTLTVKLGKPYNTSKTLLISLLINLQFIISNIEPSPVISLYNVLKGLIV